MVILNLPLILPVSKLKFWLRTYPINEENEIYSNLVLGKIDESSCNLDLRFLH